MMLANPRVTYRISRRAFLAGSGATIGAGAVGRAVPAAAAEPLLLEAKAGRAALLGKGEPSTPIWGYGGASPGPTIRVKQGDEVHARLVNGIGEPSTIHWHGIRIENRMDGVGHLTQDEVAAGASFDYRFRVPDAGTFWYHPHAHRPMQQDRGLYGLLIVEEREPVSVDREVALVIDDWRLNTDGSIETRSVGSLHDAAHAGRLGNVLTVNGEAEAKLPARAHERIRVRVVSSCNARVLVLRFENVKVQLVAIDGQPVNPEPMPGGRLVLAPAQRADLVVDVTAAPGTTAAITEVSRERLVLGAFEVAAGEPKRARALEAPVPLPRNPVTLPQPDADPLRVDLVMEGGAMGRMTGGMVRGLRVGPREMMQAGLVWTFNGIAGDPENHDPALFEVKRGRTVVVRMVNDTMWPHAMHIHGHHFQVLARTEGTAKDWLHDTILMQPREEMMIAFAADNPGKWMLHCHMLEHQVSGMQSWFAVV
jgi:FtsP/CotA-like multicopper oxidase with cupredoxin domain